MDHGLQNLAQWAEWISNRLGRYLFLVGSLLFVAGIAGWFLLACRRRFRLGHSHPHPIVPLSDPKRLARQILDLIDQPTIFLMTSERYERLPVAIPVQTAMELVRRKKRCLLVDLDLDRNAVARVFELESLPSSDPPRPIQTPFMNLHIWPAVYFNPSRSLQPDKVAAAAVKVYDIVLIYAPVLQKSPYLQPTVSVSQWVFFFHPANVISDALRPLLQQNGALIIDVSGISYSA